ncbi:MAG: hypothetical protein LBQ47_08800 [Endomicrobium sp.]|jgi:hypothetical protein|nr:hypothetical protein [Endomicrobium sp.]
MAFSLKTKTAFICAMIFIFGLLSGFLLSSIAFKFNPSNYGFHYKFEKLEPLTKALKLNDVQRALLFNVLADHKNAIARIMKPVDPKIKIQLHILRENIKSLLDDEQKVIYEKLLAQYRKNIIEE